MGFAFEKLLRQKGFNTIHASILENDLTDCGGARVHSIFHLLASGLDRDIPILHVGGESASCTFNDALACDSPAPLPYQYKDIVSSEVHQQLGTDRSFPYLTPQYERIHEQLNTWGNRLFYGIGMTRLTDDSVHHESLRQTFAAARLISFRDAHSLRNARSLGVDHAIFSPDIVLSISRLMPVAHQPGQARYLLMHFNGEYLRRNTAALIHALSQIAPRFEGGLKIGLAGTANYHDSLDDFYRFKRLAAESSIAIEVLPSVDIFTICHQIANAAAIVSTSLHYRIVARSYGVPRITMNVHKVNCWAESNDGNFPYGVEPDTLATVINSLIDSIRPVDESAQAKDLRLIDDRIETITGIIKAAAPNSERPRLRVVAAQPSSPAPDVWITSMVRCLDEREMSIKAQAEIIRAQNVVLTSKARLLRRLLHLLLVSCRRKHPWGSPSSSLAEQRAQERSEGSVASGDPHHPINNGRVVQRMGP